MYIMLILIFCSFVDQRIIIFKKASILDKMNFEVFISFELFVNFTYTFIILNFILVDAGRVSSADLKEFWTFMNGNSKCGHKRIYISAV